MFNSAVQLTFPCPACGTFLTLRSFRAAGPCPNCRTLLDVNLDVQQGPTPSAVAIEEEPGSGRRYDERRFRPVVGAPQAPSPLVAAPSVEVVPPPGTTDSAPGGPVFPPSAAPAHHASENGPEGGSPPPAAPSQT